MASHPRPRNVQRVDHHDFHGWHVCLKRAGRRHEQYFSDRSDGQAALRRALHWRDEMVALLPPPRKFKRRYVLNKTGVIGVHLTVQRTRKGTRFRYYCATWIDAAGRSRKRSFSVAKYSKDVARARAVRARREALAELLRPANRSRFAQRRRLLKRPETIRRALSGLTRVYPLRRLQVVQAPRSGHGAEGEGLPALSCNAPSL